jgi:transposase
MPKTKPKFMVAVELLRQGYSRKAVSEIMDVSVWNVGCYATYARRKGISYMPDMDAALLKHLPPKVSAWLRQQIPEGATVGDVLRAIVIDAYHDDMENTK